MKIKTTPFFNLSRFFCASIILISTIFFSCTNFMEGSADKTTIEEAIAFANAHSRPLRVFSTESETIPSGDIAKKIGENVSILCKPYPDYEFIRWQVFYKNEENKYVVYNDDDAEEIIEFADLKAKETSFHLKKDVSNILIKPYCEQRPHVISTYPYYEPAGVFKDSRIQVMFDRDMDEGSIYYTGDELSELGFTDSDINKSNLKLLTSNNEKPASIKIISLSDKVYGYIYNGEKTYKNITIQNRNGESLLNNYGEPFFEKPSILIVPPENTQMPLAFSQIITSINHNFYAAIDGTKVSMTETKRWNYLLNDKKDELAPKTTFATSLIYTTIPTSPDKTALKNLCTPKIAVYISANDTETGGSGMKSYFKISLQRKLTPNNLTVDNSPIIYKTVAYSSINGANVKFGESSSNKGEIDLLTLFGNSLPDDGIYELKFYIDDISGNSYSKTYYVNIDRTGPNVSASNLNPFNVLNSNTSIQLGYTAPSDSDFDHVDIVYAEGGTKSYSLLSNISSTSKLTSLKPGSSYDLYYKFYDCNGNFSEVKTTHTTRPNPATNVSATLNSNNTTMTVSWTYPTSGAYDGATVLYSTGTDYKTASFGNFTTSTSVSIPRNTTLTTGTQYNIWVITYIGSHPESSDIKAGKESVDNWTLPTTTISARTKPSPVSNLSVSAKDTSATISWTAAPGGKDKYQIYVKDNTAGTSYTYKTSANSSTTSSVITDLITGHYYSFRVYTISGDLSSSPVETSGYVKPNPVKDLTVSATTATSVTVKWTNPGSGNFTGHRYYYRDITAGQNDFKYYSYTNNGSSRTLNMFSGLTAGHLYEFKVVTYAYSNSTNTESDAITVQHYTRPNCVSNIKLLNNKDSPTTKIDVSWKNPDSGTYAGTMLMLGESDDISKAVYQGWKSAGTTSATLTVSSKKTYYIWVVTYTETGTSQDDVCNDTKMSTNHSGCVSTERAFFNNLGGTLKLASTEKGKIKIDWTFPSSYTTTDNIYFYYGTERTNLSDGKVNYIDWWNSGHSSKSSTYNGFTSGSTYYFWVVTVPSDGALSDKSYSATSKTLINSASNFWSITVK